MTYVWNRIFLKHPLLEVLCIIGLVLGTLTIIVGAPLYFAVQQSCHAKGASMGVASSFGFLQDCMIVVDGKNIPLDAYKVVKVTQ